MEPSPTQPNNPNNNNFNIPPNNTNPNAIANTTAFSARRAARNPAFDAKLSQMALQLAPLVQLTTGAVHRDFPRTLLAFWLLTDEQLNELAHFYHQRTPCHWTAQYPCPVTWPPGLSLEEKRRKLGKFIGLRGCDTPIEALVAGEVVQRLQRSEEEIREEAERRARFGNGSGARDDDVEEVRRKMGWY
ncbi:uncharacterized protein B0T15DRAFT_68145 [Chaetomium strumarium]|uniref:Uncharacterized protein n=1 Tax=Chaetomium strumarium TaxID=1170767 RepID=A0AAJ0H485_9PEZI|nr:hypothetical protein B0T15DRAFT_68145 [Chaetomium strumarium]